MATKDFLLPDLGEGLTEGEIVSWLVAVGDTVEVDQPVAEVETAKAVVEVPSPFAGTVVALHGEAGGEVLVGTPLVTIDVGGERRRPAARAAAAASDVSDAVAGRDRRGRGRRRVRQRARRLRHRRPPRRRRKRRPRRRRARGTAPRPQPHRRPRRTGLRAPVP